MELTLTSADHALYPLLHFVLDDLPTSTKAPELDDHNTQEIIAGTDIACPNMDELSPLYLGYLVGVGFLPSPTLKGEPLKEIMVEAKMVTRSGRGN